MMTYIFLYKGEFSESIIQIMIAIIRETFLEYLSVEIC